MAMVPLPGLAEMVEMISRERNLPRHVVTDALREALLKGYDRYRKTIQEAFAFWPPKPSLSRCKPPTMRSLCTMCSRITQKPK